MQLIPDVGLDDGSFLLKVGSVGSVGSIGSVGSYISNQTPKPMIRKAT